MKHVIGLSSNETKIIRKGSVSPNVEKRSKLNLKASQQSRQSWEEKLATLIELTTGLTLGKWLLMSSIRTSCND